MRTTVDIDVILLKRLRDAAQERGVSLKDVLNGALRRGLERDAPPTVGKFVGATFPMGMPTDPHQLDKALSVAATLEDDAVVAKLLMRK